MAKELHSYLSAYCLERTENVLSLHRELIGSKPVNKISVYETVLCAAAIPLLMAFGKPFTDRDVQKGLLDDGLLMDMASLLESFADFLKPRVVSDISLLTRQILHLPEGSHMFMANLALVSIRESLRSLMGMIGVDDQDDPTLCRPAPVLGQPCGDVKHVRGILHSQILRVESGMKAVFDAIVGSPGLAIVGA